MILSDITPDQAFREVLGQLLNRTVPERFRYAPADEEQYEDLMEWVGEPDTIFWATTTGVICAAEEIVETAIENGNIPDQPKGPFAAEREETGLHQAQGRYRVTAFTPRGEAQTREVVITGTRAEAETELWDLLGVLGVETAIEPADPAPSEDEP
jgi:hypothetical protein